MSRDTGPTPQVGDALQVRGRQYEITALEDARSGGTRVRARNADGGAVSCTLSELQLLRTERGKAWHLPGVAAPRVPNEGAIQLQPAIYDANADWRALHGGRNG